MDSIKPNPGGGPAGLERIQTTGRPGTPPTRPTAVKFSVRETKSSAQSSQATFPCPLLHPHQLNKNRNNGFLNSTGEPHSRACLARFPVLARVHDLESDPCTDDREHPNSRCLHIEQWHHHHLRPPRLLDLAGPPQEIPDDGPAEGAQLDGPVLVEVGAAVRADGRRHDHLFPGGEGAAGAQAHRGDEQGGGQAQGRGALHAEGSGWEGVHGRGSEGEV